MQGLAKLGGWSGRPKTPIGPTMLMRGVLLLLATMQLLQLHPKKELLAINGFDEDYNFPGGGEDSDIEWRLKKLPAVYFKTMRFRALVYHIFHPIRFSAEQEEKNNAFMLEKIKLGNYYCKNGLQK